MANLLGRFQIHTHFLLNPTIITYLRIAFEWQLDGVNFRKGLTNKKEIDFCFGESMTLLFAFETFVPIYNYAYILTIFFAVVILPSIN